ncbi:MAG: hypothetical protein ACRD0A_08395 [Acidimicrobiales bacterium]
MDLSSAREAKIEFRQELDNGISVASAGPGGPTPAASVAVGIALRPGRRFALALRPQDPAGPGAQVIADWVDRLGDDVDVRVIGVVRKQSIPWHRQRIRPIEPGASVSHVDVTAGTIGTFVRRPTVAAPGAVELLSNNHVLADENEAELGDQILQPGAFDGGTVADDVIGRLAAFTPIDPDGVNLVDCALSSIDDEVGWSLGTFDDDGGLTGLFDLDDETDETEIPPVAKHGRTTGRTTGTITAIELDNLRVQYDAGVVRFDDQIEVQGTGGPFSQGGDSGSLVLTAGGGARAVGLLFAGSETGGPGGGGLTYLNPIAVVLNSLDAELVLSAAEQRAP